MSRINVTPIAGLFHVQKDAGSDDEDVVVDDDTAKNGLVNLNVNWRLSCWPLALAALAFEDTSLVLCRGSSVVR